MRDGCRTYAAIAVVFSLLFCSSLYPETTVRELTVSFREAYTIRSPVYTHIDLEHATSPEEMWWGLMRRKSLGESQGMTFSFSSSRIRRFWSFNCLIDLSLAYLDENRVIREIYELPAFPEAMDDNRPVYSLNDYSLYLPDDPTIKFFSAHAKISKYPAQYVLEMNKNWFKRYGVEAGDLVHWTVSKKKGYISHTLNIGTLDSSEELPLALIFPGTFTQSLWIPEQDVSRDILYLSEAFMHDLLVLVKIDTVVGNKKLPLENTPVSTSGQPVKFALIAPSGWSKRKGLAVGEFINLKNLEKVAKGVKQ
ncbi:MAG: uncharacterized membrane protein (UPF0127 family) [Halioglobus sp.]|jgi:uncharacterized membrane protein (UPF0127 family)